MTTTPEAAPAPAAEPKAPRPPRRAWRAFGWALALTLVALAALSAFVVWCARSEPGSAWLLQRVPGLKVTAPQGALLGGDFSAQRVEWSKGDGFKLTIDKLSWQGLEVGWAASPSQWLRFSFTRLSAQRIEVQDSNAPRSGPRPRPPASLRLPVALEVAELSVAELRLPQLGAHSVTDIGGRIALGADGGAAHRLDGLRARWDRLQFEGFAHVDMKGAGPDQLQASVRARPSSAQPLPWQATLDAQGTLARLQAKATLRADKPAQGEAPSLDAQAVVTPFEPWPLASLEAGTRALDLSALVSGAPVTSLDGRATVKADGWNNPVVVDVQLGNAAAGLWNAHRLPLRRLAATLRGQLGEGRRIELQAFDVELGNERQSAGHVTGGGHVGLDDLALNMKLANVLTAPLDARIAALRISGPVTLQGKGALGDPAFNAELRADLQGQPEAAPGPGKGAATPPSPPVRLRWHARGSRDRIDIDEAIAEAGDAKAVLKGQAQRHGAAGWQATGRSDWTAFDPRPWWHGREDSPWRAGPHSVNAAIEFDVATPDLQRIELATLRGHADAALRDSVLAGVPVNGSLSLKAPGRVLDAQARLESAGNLVSAQWRWAVEGDGRGDKLQADVQAPALGKLSPLLRLLPGGPSAVGGALEGTLAVDGRWPAVTSEGRLAAQNVVVDEVKASSIQARWSAGTLPDSAIDVQLDAAQLAHGVQRLDRTALRVKGTGRAHQLSLDATSPARVPAWMEPLMGATQAPGNATALTLRAHGGFTGALAQSSGWRGTLDQLTVAAPHGQPLLATRDLGIEWQDSPSPGFALSPGRIQMLGATLRIARAQWRGGAQPALDVQAELDTMAVAPLLAQLQPDFGWGGDLVMSGKVDIRSTPDFTADVVFERAKGDLVVREPGSGTVQSLGLTDLRLALSARDGSWYFTQALAGSTLGVFAGVQSVRLPPQAIWPTADSPLGGVMEMRVDNLSTWGAWVPAGWRLTGALHTSAAFGGRFGAPELTGHMEGHRIGMRNLFEGVEVYDGEVAVSLQGERARIERFTAKAGEGTLSVEGDALLGESPRAQLSLKADRLRLIGRVDRRIITTGQARLQLDAAKLALDGSFNVDEGFFDFSHADTPSLGDDVEVIRGAQPAAEAHAAPRKARAVSLDLQVALGEKLRLRGRGIDTGLRGQLHVSAPGGKLAMDGTVRTEGGTYNAYDQNLDIERGLITFNGPIENPRLDIIATRPNLDVRVGVAVAGTALSPRVRLFSEPEMTDADKLSWLVLGRAPDGLGRTETALLQRAALALLAGEKASSSASLTQLVGLDEFSVRQTESTAAATGTSGTNGTGNNNTTVRETVVTLGKQVSRRWYVGYERGLNATTGTWQLIYRIAQRFTLRAQSGLDNSLDVIWTWRWN